MSPLRSRTVTHGRNMAGARALLRAVGGTTALAETGDTVVIDIPRHELRLDVSDIALIAHPDT